MARESQGLQIALIIFVMLTIVLGVTTFIYRGKFADALVAATESQKVAQAARSETANKDAECGDLKRMIGTAELPLADIRQKFEKDMKDYGSNFPEGNRFYNPILKDLATALESKSGEVKDLNDKLADLDRRFSNREASHNQEFANFSESMKKASEDVVKVTSEARDQGEQLRLNDKELADKLTRIRAQADKDREKRDAEVKEAEAKVASISRVASEATALADKLSRPTMDVPAGEVTYVNQRAGTVWINLGRADALERQTSFSVYAADSSDLGKAVKKASIEVTKLGEHQAECRVVDDKISDPIMPGDKIHTPLWSPGEQLHFALAGIMDLDGDGQNALETVHNLITMNSGVVDCEHDERGKITGEMTPHTRYLVVGGEPSAKGRPEAMQAFMKLVGDADRLHVRKMTLMELKQKMGYKKQAAVERFGRNVPAAAGAAPKPTPSAKKTTSAKKAAPKAKTEDADQ